MKRYEVRQDAEGLWGILDTFAVSQVEEAWGDIDAFAPWDREDGVYYPSMFMDIVEYARLLNTGGRKRDWFAWEKWEPRT